MILRVTLVESQSGALFDVVTQPVLELEVAARAVLALDDELLKGCLLIRSNSFEIVGDGTSLAVWALFIVVGKYAAGFTSNFFAQPASLHFVAHFAAKRAEKLVNFRPVEVLFRVHFEALLLLFQLLLVDLRIKFLQQVGHLHLHECLVLILAAELLLCSCLLLFDQRCSLDDFCFLMRELESRFYAS